MPRRVVVVGAGGIGGWLCDGLVKMLEYGDPGSALVIVDGDNFEIKNLERQSFEDFGNKAQVRADSIQAMHPQTFVVPMAKWVVPERAEAPAETEDGEQNEEGEESSFITPAELLEEGDIVACVVDNFAARKLIFDAARNFDNISIFTAGNDDGLFVSAYHYQRKDGKDVTDHPADWHPEYDNPPDRNPGELGCAERAELEGGTQLLATNMTAAAILLGRIQHIIFNENTDQASEIFFDLGVAALGAFDRRVEADVAAVASA